ncbi:MAG: UvrB/UvrC motif-containing protein [Candidatus Omnitrophica bacterium]|nr:UvrB/UvrC motif-containing protein [Candidatus Omnitrophota bacterium]MDD5081116.1 UvrB/UvrC motif-containing protein [Candidatus Omnitrophota bacterium]MDD5441641.1 UvrB/UvrC motif-containing protein [Candidatus Omnitrophota bacterium]
MLCSICNKAEASVHVTEVIDGNTVELHLCQDCANAKSVGNNDNLKVSGFIGGIIGAKSDKIKAKELKCFMCNMTFSQLQDNGRLGCENCYDVFSEYLMPFIKRVHGTNKHIGKVPVRSRAIFDNEKRVKEMRNDLKTAVELEEYEKAAFLRDEIKRAGGNV